jgi:cyanophycinase
MHFVTRDRLGRDLAFMCRLQAAGWASRPHIVSANESTALLLVGHVGTVVGSGHVYFLRAPTQPAARCHPRIPLTFTDISVYRIDTSGSFDLDKWEGRGGFAYSVSANNGVVTSTQKSGSLY